MLFISGMIAAAEIAFFSLSPLDLKQLELSESGSSKRVLKILFQPKKLLATVLLGSNLVNVAIIILFASLIDGLFTFNEGQEYIRFIIDAVVVTFMLLLVSEVVPKVYANQNALRVSQAMAVPIQFLSGLLSPLVWVLLRSTSIIDKRFKRRNQTITVDELGHALELTFNHKSSDQEKKILEGIVKFGNTSASQIMKSRMDVMAVDKEIGFSELVPFIIKCGYSRIPVYENSIDKITGVLVAKDLLPHLEEKNDFNWHSLIREPYFVPGSKKIDDLLADFKIERMHLAIVVDEYGGTLGIITLEDVLEEIVGDITDEFDDEDITYTKIDDRNFVFEGKTHLNDIYRVLKINGNDFEASRGEADTLAGFLLELSGKFLSKNDKLNFGRYVFTVEAADKKRIRQVKITINDELPAQESSVGTKTALILMPLLFFFASCSEEIETPRPRGYFRIEFKEPVYDSTVTTSFFSFKRNVFCDFKMVNNTKDALQYFEMNYAKYKATLYLTYVPVDTNLAYLIKDCHTLAYNHASKADDIQPDIIRHDSSHVHGLIYDFKGNAATPMQFYVTDSSTNFLRGSLYFYAKPNYDSVQPVVNYIRNDLVKALSTLQWNKK